MKGTADSASLPVIALGLNPAWQKTLVFPQLQPGEVNRAVSVDAFASGKGINFCRAAGIWGYRARLLQFLGGWTGERIRDELDAENIAHHSIPTAVPTRTCNTCLSRADGAMTELIEPSGVIALAEKQALFDALEAELASARGLAVCGTYPPGIDETLYVTAVRTAHARRLPILLDSWKDIPTLLRECPFDLLKINVEELGKITGDSKPATAVRHSFQLFRHRYAAITDGGNAAWFGNGPKLFRLELPKVQVVNPLGCGDTVSAVMFGEYLDGTDPLEAFALGLAAASASATEFKCAVFSPALARKLRHQMTITPIDA